MTGGMYLTGKGGDFFSKMFVYDKFDQSCVISSDMPDAQVDQYFEYAGEFGITLDVKIKDM